LKNNCLAIFQKSHIESSFIVYWTLDEKRVEYRKRTIRISIESLVKEIPKYSILEAVIENKPDFDNLPLLSEKIEKELIERNN
jgi:hypothetical protein